MFYDLSNNFNFEDFHFWGCGRGPCAWFLLLAVSIRWILSILFIDTSKPTRKNKKHLVHLKETQT